MFYSMISKETFNAIMQMFFRNIGTIDETTSLEIEKVIIGGQTVEFEAEVKQETVN